MCPFGEPMVVYGGGNRREMFSHCSVKGLWYRGCCGGGARRSFCLDDGLVDLISQGLRLRKDGGRFGDCGSVRGAGGEELTLLGCGIRGYDWQKICFYEEGQAEPAETFVRCDVRHCVMFALSNWSVNCK